MKSSHIVLMSVKIAICVFLFSGCNLPLKSKRQVTLSEKKIDGFTLSKNTEGLCIEKDGQLCAKLRTPAIAYYLDKVRKDSCQEVIEIDSVTPGVSDNQKQAIVVNWSKCSMGINVCSIAQAYLFEGEKATFCNESIVYLPKLKTPFPYRVNWASSNYPKLEINVRGRFASVGTMTRLITGVFVETKDGSSLLPILNPEYIKSATSLNNRDKIALWGQLLNKRNNLSFEVEGTD